MIIYKEQRASDHKAWSGAVETLERIKYLGLEDSFNNLIEELYPDGIDETKLNDILCFEEDWIFEMLGVEDEY